MPRTRREKPLYRRGDFALYPRSGRNHEIVWYDHDRKRERSASAGTRDLQQARIEVDRRYLGSRACPTCGRPLERDGTLVASIITDYLTSYAPTKPTCGSITDRLRHVIDYISQLDDQAVLPTQIDERWVQAFRDWLKAKTFQRGSRQLHRSPSTIEGCVTQLAAAIRWAKEPVKFTPMPLRDLSRTPEYRADTQTMSRMFAYALEHPARENLLAFLRFSVMTWSRPDAAFDASTDPRRGQWLSSARVFALNPKGRRQTRKYRATVPIPECAAWWLDSIDGPVLRRGLSKATWQRMEKALGLPGEGQSGMKLIRRSMATLARRQLGEEHWVQGRIMLGHVQPTTSDTYAVRDRAHLGRVLDVTTAIVEELERRVPGSFYRTFTAQTGQVILIGSKKSERLQRHIGLSGA